MIKYPGLRLVEHLHKVLITAYLLRQALILVIVTFALSTSVMMVRFQFAFKGLISKRINFLEVYNNISDIAIDSDMKID